jgi:AraC-like DNA-binding protein
MKVFREETIGSRFILTDQFSDDILKDDDYFLFIWNNGSEPVEYEIDDRSMKLLPDQVSCCTWLQHIHFCEDHPRLNILCFNREFYCVHTNDSEVSCNGLLFFGSNTTPVLTLDAEENERLTTLFTILAEEFDERDSSQEEMLRILLKRFIIRCTRLAKKQLLNNAGDQHEVDIIRHFNVLVEEHFREKKTVQEYADLMHKSPKTITNAFYKNSDQTPLHVITQRVIIEAKRMLLYTDKAAKTIGYELGYEDPAHFSRLFKRVTGQTTTEFKNSKEELGTMA